MKKQNILILSALALGLCACNGSEQPDSSLVDSEQISESDDSSTSSIDITDMDEIDILAEGIKNTLTDGSVVFNAENVSYTISSQASSYHAAEIDEESGEKVAEAYTESYFSEVKGTASKMTFAIDDAGSNIFNASYMSSFEGMEGTYKVDDNGEISEGNAFEDGSNIANYYVDGKFYYDAISEDSRLYDVINGILGGLVKDEADIPAKGYIDLKGEDDDDFDITDWVDLDFDVSISDFFRVGYDLYPRDFSFKSESDGRIRMTHKLTSLGHFSLTIQEYIKKVFERLGDGDPDYEIEIGDFKLGASAFTTIIKTTIPIYMKSVSLISTIVYDAYGVYNVDMDDSIVFKDVEADQYSAYTSIALPKQLAIAFESTISYDAHKLFRNLDLSGYEKVELKSIREVIDDIFSDIEWDDPDFKWPWEDDDKEKEEESSQEEA